MGGRAGHWDGAGLERKIRSAGRPWTVGDITMIADGQWTVRTHRERWQDAAGEAATVLERAADGWRVEMTLEELARAVGARPPEAHRDDAGQ